MKSLVQAKAKELGFDACRVVRVESSEASIHFDRWLAAGRHGEMQYLERTSAKRKNPGLVLEGAQSIVVLAASYHLPDGDSSNSWHRGIVARYAQHTDYHAVIGSKLSALSRFLDELGGPVHRSKCYVDTGPLLERDLAERAGLGFVGKHTNLIRRDLGNWLVLAEILTTLALEPDLPEHNHCGRCVRCLEACPTNAITAPFQLDARRCISYLTIELKGPIPLELRTSVGRRIFGCDDCLAVCPWNRFAREGRLLRDHRREDIGHLELLSLLNLSEDEFKRRFADTPLMRPKRRGLLRNVCVALGNVGDESCLPALARSASDPEPLIAEHARWAIDQIEVRRASCASKRPVGLEIAPGAIDATRHRVVDGTHS